MMVPSDTSEDTLELPAALLQGLRGMVHAPDSQQDGELWDPERLEQHGRFLATEGGLVYGSGFHARGDLKRTPARECARAGRGLWGDRRGLAGRPRHLAGRAVDRGQLPRHLRPPQTTSRCGSRHGSGGRLPGSAHAGTSGPPRVMLIAAEYLRHTLWDFDQELLIRMLRGLPGSEAAAHARDLGAAHRAAHRAHR